MLVPQGNVEEGAAAGNVEPSVKERVGLLVGWLSGGKEVCDWWLRKRCELDWVLKGG